MTNEELELIKATQEIIKRMADNSSKTKTVFLAITTAIITLLNSDSFIGINIALLIYLSMTISLWFTDAKYLQLEQLFRKHHNAIIKRELALSKLWEFNLGRYHVETVCIIMFKNFTMLIYWVASLSTIFLIIY